ncbi:hypothetical protein Lal_00020433 [Lupinus albus]|uniref:Putative PetM of cytochrome b6/f complex subunit 7 n=1 Tax=Lupinus albus TaxID=3870 RepID=A0A6A5MF75_LUPAL|nr:putative PetM of cytochrome b6/f complex subunit 7 [Lupinus albus]KAF1871639.1 hypothetical protein Lal_00020433 [Lupinus albus]
MAMATTILTPQSITAGTIMSSTTKSNKRIMHARGLNSFVGLKTNNGVISLGLPFSTEKCFAKIVSSLKTTSSNGKGKRGGAFSSTCNAAGEIFTIATIINALVLVGVAIGFVLLRIEAFVEEQEVE